MVKETYMHSKRDLLCGERDLLKPAYLKCAYYTYYTYYAYYAYYAYKVYYAYYACKAYYAYKACSLPHSGSLLLYMQVSFITY